MARYKAKEVRLDLTRLEELLKQAQLLEAHEFLNDAHIEPNELVLRVLRERNKDYIYCQDCQMFVDLWKYHSLADTGHEGHNWRYVTDEELAECIKDCQEAGCFEG